MSKMQDLSGQKFNKLTVVRLHGKSKGKILWECLCDCGGIAIVQATGLRNNHTKSCGCLQVEEARKAINKVNATYNLSKIHGYTKTRTYNSWQSMISRCNNPKTESYKRYGAKGITFCERWLDFKNFLADMGERPENTTLDRIENLKGYEPSNCRWADIKTQNSNRDLTNMSKSGHSGVTWNKSHKMWECYTTENGKKKHIGYFKILEDAVEARKQLNK